MIEKQMVVRAKGLRGTNEYVFHNGRFVDNPDSRGILFAGFNRPGTNDRRYAESKYLPYDLILDITIEDEDGGMVFVRDPRFLRIADDIAQVYRPEGCYVE